MRSTKARDPVHAHCTSAALLKQQENSLACWCYHTYDFWHLTQLGPCSHHCTRAALQSKVTTALLVGVTTPMYEFRHLTQLCCISAEMHSTKAWDPNCTSAAVKQSSLACRCSRGHLASSAAIQQRCAAPKPGTLFTLTVLHCEAPTSKAVFILLHSAALVQ